MTNTIETALQLRLEASLAKFERQMARARKAGADASTKIQRQFDSSNKMMAKSAERSAMAIGREMDRLRAKYDPVFAASKRYEAALEELNRAHKLGAIDARQHAAALDRLNAKYAAGTKGTARMGRSFRGLSLQTRGMGGGIQNVAFQIGDFATQVGAGTSATIALGQQLPQLLGGFGVLGAVMGAVVAIGVPLTAALVGMGDAADDAADENEKLADYVRDLETALDQYKAASEAASQSTEELAGTYGDLAGEARKLLEEQEELARLRALREWSEAIQAVAKDYGDLFVAIDTASQAGGAPRMVEEMALRESRQAVEALGQAFGLTNDQVDRFIELRRQAQRARGFEEQADAVRRLKDFLLDANGTVEDMNTETQDFYEQLVRADNKALELSTTLDEVPGIIARATTEADTLTAALNDAVNAANALMASSLSELRVSEIELQYRDDPVGRARALAGERFDRDTGDISGLDPIVQRTLNAQRDAYIERVEAIERIRMEEKARQEQERRAARAGRGSGRRRRRERREFDPFTLGEAQIQALERQTEMLGKTSAQVAELRTRYAMLDEAKRRNIDLDRRSAETGMTVGETIDANARKIGDLVSAYEQAADRAEFFDGINHQLKDGILDAIIEGENFVGVLKDIAKGFARAALEAALFGTGPLAGGTSGASGVGGFVGVLNGLFGGFRASGGGMMPGRFYRVNERGQEMAMNAAATARFRPQLEAMNQGRVPGFGSDGHRASTVQVTYAPVYQFEGTGAELDAFRQQAARDRAEFDGRVVQSVKRAVSRRQL